METTRHRKLEKTDSIPTDDIIMGTEEPKTETLEDIPQSGDTGMLSESMSSLSPKWRNYWIRIITSWLMLFGFIFVGYCGPIAIVLLVLAIQIKCFHEIITIGYMVYRNYELPWFRTISWYFLFCANYFFYGETINEYFGVVLSKDVAIHFLFKHHRIISYLLYCFGVIGFVCSLVKTYYRLQFFMFGWTHVTLLLITGQSHMCMQNIFNGVIWFVLPVLLVAANDTWAYFCGFFLGKKFFTLPLIKLSPKKSWEGFIGGGMLTLVWGSIFASFLSRFSLLICPVQLDVNWHVISNCTPPAIFVPQEYSIPFFLRPIGTMLGFGATAQIASFQFHVFFLGIFASLIAPFGGFFASGFKRAFRIKDFGDMIPGHGGLMDRFDCHYVMATFVNVYLSSFIRTPSIQNIMALINKLSLQEQESLLAQLQEQIQTR